MPQNKQILLIEDDPDIRESIQQFLELEGFIVTTAKNGKEGLELLAKMPTPCLILLDLFMPVMDGSQFLQALKRDHTGGNANLPVVVLTAAPAQSDTAQNAMKYSTAFVRKPIELRNFLKLVEQYCC